MNPRRVREGEPVVLADDFDTVFTRERTPMVRLAFLMLGSESLAEEVVHDAFVAVLERWDRVDNPGAYLRKCVVNGCFGQMRRARRLRPVPVAVAATATAAVAPPATDHTLDAVRRLPAQRHAMVVLRFYADMTQDEIAATLGVPVGTVKSGLHRALGELKEALRDESE
jgi:RNA polymerase sigma factor (sigma-70 family)